MDSRSVLPTVEGVTLNLLETTAAEIEWDSDLIVHNGMFFRKRMRSERE